MGKMRKQSNIVKIIGYHENWCAENQPVFTVLETLFTQNRTLFCI